MHSSKGVTKLLQTNLAKCNTKADKCASVLVSNKRRMMTNEQVFDKLWDFVYDCTTQSDRRTIENAINEILSVVGED
jgi:DNA-binding response OmpR family regulator